MGDSRSVRSYARLKINQEFEFASGVRVGRVTRVYAPLSVVSENRIRLADGSELSLSGWIVVYIRMVFFTELMERFVNDSPRSG